jgi:hypothetical protein
MCRAVRLKGLERGIYNRCQVEKILDGAEGGALRWLVPLSLVFTIELWHLGLEDGQLDTLRPLFDPGDRPGARSHG